MAVRLQEESADREAERERSRHSDIESRRRWAEKYAAMKLDEVIEIPGKQGGKDIVIRAMVAPGGRITEVK